MALIGPISGKTKDAADAAKKALEAGVDIDMMTSVYAANLCRLVEEGEVDEHLIDECCLRILELKNKLGLFENPYKDADAEKEKAYNLCPEHRALAKKAAEESFVLLKNDGVLPLDTAKKIAFVGPYTNNHEIKSSWSFTGDSKDCVTIQEAAEKVFDASRTTYAEGCPVIGNDVELIGFTETTPKKYSEEELAAMEQSALQAAKEADLVVMPMGEHYLQSGEATSRAMIDVFLCIGRKYCLRFAHLFHASLERIHIVNDCNFRLRCIRLGCHIVFPPVLKCDAWNWFF